MSRNSINRAAPADYEAENALLACVFLDPAILPSVAELVNVEAFRQSRVRLTYGAALRLLARGIHADVTLIVGDLRDHGQFDELGDSRHELPTIAWLASLFDLLPASAHWRWYAARVRAVADRRSIYEEGMRRVEEAQSGFDVRVLPVWSTAP